MTHRELYRAICEILAAVPGRTKYDLVGILSKTGYEGVSTHTVNSILYQYTETFEFRTYGDMPSRYWYLRDTRNAASIAIKNVELGTGVEDIVHTFDLYPWQRQALEAWKKNGWRGVIEAVTGSGKTWVALAAIEHHLAHGYRVVVLVHSIPLMNQWIDFLNKEFSKRLDGEFLIGRIGAGYSHGPQYCHVVVATAQSASHFEFREHGSRVLLVADECHHYGAEKWAEALSPSFQRRLGLTATYERRDRGIEDYLDPYFNGVCYQVGYETALQQEIIAHFKIAFLGVAFQPGELSVYQAYDEQASAPTA